MENLQEILKKLSAFSNSSNNLKELYKENTIPTELVCITCGGKKWLTPIVPVWHEKFGSVKSCPDCESVNLQKNIGGKLTAYTRLGNMQFSNFAEMTPEGKLSGEENKQLFKNSLRASIEFSKSPNGWLALQGPHGSGKTHLATAIGNDCAKNGHPTLFVFLPDLIDKLRGSYSNQSDSHYENLIEETKTFPILIIDGIYAPPNGSWISEKLLQIFNYRINNSLPTVITTSEDLIELGNYLQNKITDTKLCHLVKTGINTNIKETTIEKLGDIPTNLAENSFNNFNINGAKGAGTTKDVVSNLTRALTIAEKYASDPVEAGWITFWSDNSGVGKTHLASAIANTLKAKGYDVFFGRAPDILDYLRNSYFNNKKLNNELIFDKIKEFPILVLDDLGVENDSPWATQKLYQLIAHRHDYRLPTVFTSRDNIPQGAKDGSATDSRIQDPSIGSCIKISAPDYRLQ
jgi:DNA replication protein DnaC